MNLRGSNTAKKAKMTGPGWAQPERDGRHHLRPRHTEKRKNHKEEERGGKGNCLGEKRGEWGCYKRT